MTRSEKRILSTVETRRLIEKATDGSRDLIATLALSGLRQSEALGLTWQDVDFEAGVLRVPTSSVVGRTVDASR